jgi:hypothetical protein
MMVPRPSGTKARRLPPDQESAETADAPEVFELRRRHLAEIEPLIVAGIRGDEICGLEARARRHRAIEQSRDVVLPGRIGHDRRSAAARRHDRLRDLVDFVRSAPYDKHVIATDRKPPAQRCAKPAFGSDTHDDCDRLTHIFLA